MTKACCFRCKKRYDVDYGVLINLEDKMRITGRITSYYVCKECGEEIRNEIEKIESEEE